MGARIEITPEIRRIIQEGRARTPKPVPWAEIANAIGVKSWRTPINMAIRLGIYKRTLARYVSVEDTGGRAEVDAAWARMKREGLIPPGRQPPSL